MPTSSVVDQTLASLDTHPAGVETLLGESLAPGQWHRLLRWATRAIQDAAGSRRVQLPDGRQRTAAELALRAIEGAVKEGHAEEGVVAELRAILIDAPDLGRACSPGQHPAVLAARALATAASSEADLELAYGRLTGLELHHVTRGALEARIARSPVLGVHLATRMLRDGVVAEAANAMRDRADFHSDPEWREAYLATCTLPFTRLGVLAGATSEQVRSEFFAQISLGDPEGALDVLDRAADRAAQGLSPEDLLPLLEHENGAIRSRAIIATSLLRQGSEPALEPDTPLGRTR